VFLQQQAQPSGFISFVSLAIILAIFYVIVFLPARNRQKKLQAMIDSLKTGDKVITSGGIYGTIVSTKDDRIQLRIAENVKIELSRNAVTALQQPEQQ
jgi:preprotein translocase subunit YajC